MCSNMKTLPIVATKKTGILMQGVRMNVDYELLQRGCDRAREIRLMQEWWRRKHPNPRPIGRPRKEAA